MMVKTMRCVSAAAILAVAGMSTAQMGAVNTPTPQIDVDPGKLQGGLTEVLADAAPDQLIAVQIVMAEQADRDLIEQYKQLPLAERRDAVIELLQHVAEETQVGVLAELRVAEAAGKAEHIHSLWIANLVPAIVTPDVAMAMAARDDVAYVRLDRPMDDRVRPVEPADPEMGDVVGADEITAGADITCGVNLVGAPNVWTIYNNRGAGAVVGVIDTGVCVQHPDLAGHIWNNPGEIPNNGIDDDNNGFIDDVVGWDFDNNDNNPNDQNGHGTHCAGTVAGDGTNGNLTGVAPEAQIMGIRYRNNINAESIAWQCVQYATLMRVDVISNSYGWWYDWDPNRQMWRMVCENAIAAGVISVWAAGNEGTRFGAPENVRVPGDVPGVITVGAIDCNNNAAGFTSRGPVSWQTVFPWLDHPYPPGLIKPDVAAPGVNTLSLSNNCSGYRSLSGTSMATPHVAGIAALMRTANPEITHEQAKQILKDTAIDLGPSGPDNTFGWGRVDALAAVEAAIDLVGGCNTDWDGNGEVNAADVGSFLSDYFADIANGTLNADYDGNGETNAADVGAFLSDYFVELSDGC